MDVLRWSRPPQPLAAPLVVAAFRGWNDAGEAATGAVSYLASAAGAETVADVDPELFFDFQSHRPRVSVTAGELDGPIELPAVEVLVGHMAGGRDLVLIRGSEPSMRWPSLCRALIEAVVGLGARDFVTLGALLADVPHTRPIRLSALSNPTDMTASLVARRPDYQGPTGIVSLIHASAIEHGLRAASLWAAVPHYVGGAPCPTASLSLLRAIETIAGVHVDPAELEGAIREFEDQVNDAVAASPQAGAMVGELEQAYDREEAIPFGPLPTGDAIAADFERFLREQAGGGEDAPSEGIPPAG